MRVMNQTREELREETEKWLEKLEERLEDADTDVSGEMENVTAYKSDAEHFLEEEDYIRAFESVVYAWGILETLERLGELPSSQ